MKKAISFLMLLCMLLTWIPSYAAAGYEAEYLMDLSGCWDVVMGYSSFAVQNRNSGLYTIYDEDFQQNGEQYIACYAVSEARNEGVDLFRVAKENGINIFGYVNGKGETVVPPQYGRVEYLSDRWQYGIYVEKADPVNADFKSNDGTAYSVAHYDFYYRGQKVLTLGRDQFDGVSTYGYAYGDYLLLRDAERSIRAYDKTGSVSYSGSIESTSEFDGWRTYTHIPTGKAAFVSGCSLSSDEVKQDLMPDGGVYYDLQGNTLKLDNFYSSVYRFEGNYARVERQGKYGLINREGKEVIPCEFDSSTSYEWPAQYEKFGYVVASVNGKMCFVNADGQITYQSPYDESVIKGSNGIIRYLQDLTGEYILLTPEGGQLEKRYKEYPQLFTGSPVCTVVEDDGSISVIDVYGRTIANHVVNSNYSSQYMTGSGHLLFIFVGNNQYAVYKINATAEPVEVKREEDSKWICPNCGKENSGNFCGDCGTPKPVSSVWHCPTCGQENEGNFCMNCGTARPS